MFIAGTDTTSSTVKWGTAEIFKNPAIHTKLTSELDRVVGIGWLVEESDIPNLDPLPIVHGQRALPTGGGLRIFFFFF